MLLYSSVKILVYLLIDIGYDNLKIKIASF